MNKLFPSVLSKSPLSSPSCPVPSTEENLLCRQTEDLLYHLGFQDGIAHILPQQEQSGFPSHGQKGIFSSHFPTDHTRAHTHAHAHRDTELPICTVNSRTHGRIPYYCGSQDTLLVTRNSIILGSKKMHLVSWKAKQKTVDNLPIALQVRYSSLTHWPIFHFLC